MVRNLGRLTPVDGSPVTARIDALEERVNEVIHVLDKLLSELEEGTPPRKAAMIARDLLEECRGELEPTG